MRRLPVDGKSPYIFVHAFVPNPPAELTAHRIVDNGPFDTVASDTSYRLP